MKAILLYASFYHELDVFLELFPTCYPLNVFINHVARLWEGITGSRLHSRVRLPAVIGRWCIASLIFSLRVRKFFT